MRKFVLYILLCLSTTVRAQTSDSLIVGDLREYGITFSHNNSVVLLMNGQDKFDDMFEAIRHAKSSIHLEYFNFRNDSIANLLFKILEKKAKEGVEVRALFDAFGNTSNNRPLKDYHLKDIRDNGVEIYKFDPIRFPWINHVWARDHRKIVIIDGLIGYTGGMNVADYYIKGTPTVGSWHDMHCRIEGDEVNTLQRIFLKIWNKVTGKNVHGTKYYYYRMKDEVPDATRCDFTRKTSYTSELAKINTTLRPDTTPTAFCKMVGIINREPLISNKIIRQFYISAITHAHDSIKIINPYFTLNHSLKKALKKAVKRGVKVEIMLSVKSDIPLTPDCGFYNAHKLMKEGCDIWMYKPGFHHTKIIMIDGRVCTVGSANLNARSLNWDYEENAVIIDKSTTKQLDNMFDSEKKDCFKLTQQNWNEWRSPWNKFVGWFGHLLSHFL